MTNCDKCNRKIRELPFHCKYCGGYFCGNHRLPEDHNCRGIKKENEKAREKWKLALTSEPKRKETFERTRFLRNNKRDSGEAIRKRNNLVHWLNRREHSRYNLKRRLNYIIEILLLFTLSVVGYNLFYSNAEKLNSINLWIIQISGVLILLSIFFICKYSLKIIKETINIIKRQKNFIKLIGILLVLGLIGFAFQNKDSLFNPILDYKEKTNFSYFNPLILDSSENGIESSGNEHGFLDSLTDLFTENPEDYRTNPKTINLGSFNYVVYGGVNDYLAELPREMSYYYVPPSNRDFIMRDLDNKIQRYYLLPFVEKIQEKTTSKKEQANIAIRIVQGIPYDWGAYSSRSVTGRYPYEVLYDEKGVCMEKADLLAFTLRELGFGVVIFEFEKESHRAVGIKCSKGNYQTDYCFIESTDYYPIGQIPSSYVGGVDIRRAIPEVIVISEGDSFD